MKIVEVQNIIDDRGSLAVFEKNVPFDIKRVFFLSEVGPGKERGGHGHLTTKLAALSVSGSCDIKINNGKSKSKLTLKKFDKMVILNPEDWHILSNFTTDCVVAVFASEGYDKDDYFFTEPAL